MNYAEYIIPAYAVTFLGLGWIVFISLKKLAYMRREYGRRRAQSKNIPE